MIGGREGDHYNARGLSPETILRSFVPSSQFFQVANSNSSVLVGPRGSGKTTLLRMLDPRALYPWWGASDATDGYSRPEAIGIFVPIDTAWISSLDNAIGKPVSDGHPGVYLATYSLAAARSLVDTLRWRVSKSSVGTNLHVSSDSDLEASIAERLSRIWFGASQIRSLVELRLRIAELMSELPSRWRKDPVVAESDSSALLNPVQAIAAACEVINILLGQEDQRWMLLCDEMEIAPSIVQHHLFAALRAAPPLLSIKIALTPKQKIPLESSLDQPLPAHDYDVVSLSYPTREEGATEREREAFCVAIWKSLIGSELSSARPGIEDPFRALEDSPAAKLGHAKSRAPKEMLDVRFGQSFRSLAEKDESFRAYLSSKSVFLADLDRNEQGVRDAVIRKVRPIVEARDYFLKSDGSGGLVRASRRAPTLYCGARRVFAVSEGHPRWLKYTLGSMLSRARGARPFVPIAIQNKELSFSVQRVEARLRALPSPNMPIDDLVNAIGEYFASQVFSRVFHADPYLSFIVDENASNELVEGIEQALYLGAVVPIQSDIYNLFTKGLGGRRFRLSNWLAPRFGLPLMTGKPAQLSAIFSGRNPDGASPQIALELDE